MDSLKYDSSRSLSGGRVKMLRRFVERRLVLPAASYQRV